MRHFKFALSVLAAIACLGQGSARSEELLRDRNPCPQSGGGSGASPFGPNRLVELAGGELYQLRGVVRARGRDAYFLEIDFCAHPWLASAQRRKSPYYLLSQLRAGTWAAYEGRKIEVAVKAHTHVMVGNNLEGQFVIWLEPLDRPVERPQLKR